MAEVVLAELRERHAHAVVERLDRGVHAQAPSVARPGHVQPAELADFTPDQIERRPELAQLRAEESAADAEVRLARAERRPSLSYTVTAGIDDSAIRPSRDLGASAAIESIACVQSIRTGWVHPTINQEYPDPDCDLDYIPNVAREVGEIKIVLKNS